MVLFRGSILSECFWKAPYTHFNFVVKYILELSALVYHPVHKCYVHAHVCEPVDNILNLLFTFYGYKPQDLEIIM